MPAQLAEPFTPQERAEIIETYGAFVSITDAAKINGCSTRTIDREIERGNLRLFKVGSSRTLRVKTIDALALMREVA